MKKESISLKLANNQSLLVIWCTFAAFGAYFCTYAFRKPYSTGLFEGFHIGQMEYKTIIIIAQVIGYMLSKFICVKVISELQAKNRLFLIISLIGIAQVSLVLFGLVPQPYNVVFMFFNGLPLGMVWGVIFSFLEGRRFTELIGMGLSVNMIMTSGILKTIYKYIQLEFHFSDFSMPFILGFLFLPLFLFFVWMLSQIPKPNEEEQSNRMARKPMSKFQKRRIWIKYAPGLLMVILAYALFTTLRDFRDNFAIEIWQRISPGMDPSIFAKTESLIALVVMAVIGLMVLIKKNILAYNVISISILISMLGLFLSVQSYLSGVLSPYQWMVSLGVCFYLPYLLIQIAFFERLIAVLRLKANAGFFVYLCDSVGYLGSVALLLYKEFLAKEMNYDQLLIRFSMLIAVLCFFLLIIQYFFFSFKIKTTARRVLESEPVQLAD